VKPPFFGYIFEKSEGENYNFVKISFLKSSISPLLEMRFLGSFKYLMRRQWKFFFIFIVWMLGLGEIKAPLGKHIQKSS